MKTRSNRQQPKGGDKKGGLLKKILSAALLIFGLALVLVLLRPGRSGFTASRGRDPYNVILVTVDTLRADRLGCYGHRPDATPAINKLAAEGLLFENCIAPTPLTLPSHTTILTGTLPLHHGVRDNGGFVVPAQLETMAECFQTAGYKTAAFVSAYVLDSRWGLNQGFDYYFDRFDLNRFEKISLMDVQRPASETISQALDWLDNNQEQKFFVWIHLYDPHSPYEPPESYSSLYSDDPYLGEIAYTDSQLDRLWFYLEKNKLLSNLLFIFTSDHGESLGEHQEATHGFFVYQEAIHVPLILVTPFEKFKGKRTSALVTLTDIMPTVLKMAGLSVPPEVQGQSLIPFFSKPEKPSRRPAYAETYYPRYHYGWSELRSLQDGRWKLIAAPTPELYDLKNDPNEEKNLVYLQGDVYKKLSRQIEQLEKKAGEKAIEPDFSSLDAATRERLAALGYLGSFLDPARLKGKKLADPKEKINIFNEISRAKELGLAGKLEEAITILIRILGEDPEIADGYFDLGNLYFKSKKYPEALQAFSRALELKPDNGFAATNIIYCYSALNQLDQAEEFVHQQLNRGLDDSQLYYVLGLNLAVAGKLDRALNCFQECLKINPRQAAAHNDLAGLYLILNDQPRAEEHLQAAREINPELLDLNYNFAQLREKQNRPAEAMEFYQKEIVSSPNHFKALFNLARLYRLQNRTEEELEVLRRALKANPEFPLTYFYLARNYLMTGQRYLEAVELVEKGLALKPEPQHLAFGYMLLAELNNRLGDRRKAEEYARQADRLLKARR
ncbi:MAG: sulfatase-like hydrolase/transferase [Candidatus Saccharicenans sp.]|jgi:arylsulfatase A-like enzyme/Tfp pilus assembly protein PilF|nr:sulfatase-like hydrolase/transferase [Candidatus Saccharicenans sp.]MDH7493024.1 sulfatase-like hydrolase/transferase [Candidatus Saccharicenans sp.]